MEMIGEQAPCQDAHLAEALALAEQGAEMLFLGGLEDEAPIHDA
jgi:hypothetical protein